MMKGMAQMHDSWLSARPICGKLYLLHTKVTPLIHHDIIKKGMRNPYSRECGSAIRDCHMLLIEDPSRWLCRNEATLDWIFGDWNKLQFFYRRKYVLFLSTHIVEDKYVFAPIFDHSAASMMQESLRSKSHSVQEESIKSHRRNQNGDIWWQVFVPWFPPNSSRATSSYESKVKRSRKCRFIPVSADLKMWFQPYFRMKVDPITGYSMFKDIVIYRNLNIDLVARAP